MKILSINPSLPPVPYGSGMQVHNWGNIQALQLLGHEIFLVMLLKYGDDIEMKIETANHANKSLKLCTAIEVPEQQNRSLNSLSPCLVLKELIEPIISKESYLVKNHQLVCLQLERLIAENEIQLIWYEDFYVAIYDNWINRKIPAIYNSHDNQARLYKQKNLNSIHSYKRIGSKIRRIIYQNRHWALEKSEFSIQKRCDIMLTGNFKDVALSKSRRVNALSRRVPIIGANDKFLDERKNYINKNEIKKNRIKLLHLGALYGSFTSKSLSWFLDDIWKTLLSELKDFNIELHIIGSGEPSKDLLKSIDQPNIIYRGYVENLWKEFIDTFAMLIPGQVSTGIRIRMPVAFSMMIPVIGNEVSFRGMPGVKDGETVLYAENAAGYSEAVRKLRNNTSFYKLMCENVRIVYNNNFSIKSASADIQHAISMLN